MNTLCVSRPEVGAVGRKSGRYFSCMLSPNAKGSTAQPSHCHGGRDRGGEGRESASVFSPKVLLTHFLLAGGGGT